MTNKKILITGCNGYVGSAVIRYLKNKYPNAYLIGFDTNYFGTCLTSEQTPETLLVEQYFGDIRQVWGILHDVDTVIHLAAISNDPIGKLAEDETYDINFKSTIKWAIEAKMRGVKNFIFASSCSVYGYAEDENELNENSNLNPLTAYAKSKAQTEKALENLISNHTPEKPDFKVTCLRFATACGWSDRTRFDLVVNDFTYNAFFHNEINILSDGKPFRPIIDIKDMARSMDWAMNRKTGENYEVVNVGTLGQNYSVKEIADIVSSITNSKININPDAQSDKRSYKVDFKKYYQLAEEEYHPKISLEQSINEILKGLFPSQQKYFAYKSDFIRLDKIKKLQEQRLINKELKWIN